MSFAGYCRSLHAYGQSARVWHATVCARANARSEAVFQSQHDIDMYILRTIRPDKPWTKLRQLQWIMLGLFVGFIPVGHCLIMMWGSNVLFPFAAIYGGVFLFCQDRAINWKCPKCKKPFLRRRGNGTAMLWRRCCGNCSLKLGSLNWDSD